MKLIWKYMIRIFGVSKTPKTESEKHEIEFFTYGDQLEGFVRNPPKTGRSKESTKIKFYYM